MTLYYYEEVNQIKEPMYMGNLAIVLATVMCSSLSSWYVGDEYRSSTIRHVGVHPAVEFFYSHLQMAGFSGCLYGLRRYSIMFYFAFILQIQPFFMTLRRKNLSSKTVGLFVYSAMLIAGWIVGEYELRHYPGVTYNHRVCQDLITLLATLLRLGPRLPVISILQNNKYLMWLSLGLLLRQIRPYFDNAGEGGLSEQVIFLRHILIGAVLLVWLWKGFLRDRYRIGVEKKTV